MFAGSKAHKNIKGENLTNEVAVSVKIFLEDGKKISETLLKIKTVANVANFKTEDVGFGIKALKIIFLMADSGGINELEEKIATIPNVSQVQIEEISRL